MITLIYHGVIEVKKQICDHEDCWEYGDEYRVDNRDSISSDIVYIYCWTHAQEWGFCPACKRFAAGADDDHQSRTGFCYECWQDMAEEIDDMDDDPEFDYIDY